jgi:hypothetical protein
MSKGLCIFLISFLLFIHFNSFSQDTPCKMSLDTSWLRINAPARYQRFVNSQNFINSYSSSQNSSYRLIDPNGVIIIPVVVHVLHQGEGIGSGFNIPDAQIQSQIQVLNEDYRMVNASHGNTPADFASRTGDIKLYIICHN